MSSRALHTGSCLTLLASCLTLAACSAPGTPSQPTGVGGSAGTGVGGSAGTGFGGGGAGGVDAVGGTAGTGFGGIAGTAGTGFGGMAGTAGTGFGGTAGTAGTGFGGMAGTAGSAGAAGVSGTAGMGGTSSGNDEMPWFSFFVASMDGLVALSGSPDGFGGDLGGLEGADSICTQLAQQGNPGDGKVWRAFLSTSGVNGGEAVDAIDRIGPGPWYDYNARLFAENVADLVGEDGRPVGDPQLTEMFTHENGEPMRPSQEIDNHDTLTGSDSEGRLFSSDAAATCGDWTDDTLHGMVPVGHGWPRSANNGRDWISDHTVNGCEPGIAIEPGGGAPMGDYRVGAGGGYGAIFCFALGAVAP